MTDFLLLSEKKQRRTSGCEGGIYRAWTSILPLLEASADILPLHQTRCETPSDDSARGKPRVCHEGLCRPSTNTSQENQSKGTLRKVNILSSVYVSASIWVLWNVILEKNTCTGIHKPLRRKYNFQIWFSIVEATNEGKK